MRGARMKEMKMALSEKEISIIQLIKRSQDTGDGWRNCNPALFDQLILNMTDELVEKDYNKKRVRFTEEGLVVIKWII